MIFELDMKLGKSIPLNLLCSRCIRIPLCRFGRQYLMLQKGSEDLRPAKLKDFQPDLRKHNKKEFHLEYVQ